MSLTEDELARHLRSLEESLLDPAFRRKSGQVAALLAGGFEEFGASGRVWTREQILELVATEKYDPPQVEDFRCALIAEGVALVTYRTVRTAPDSGERMATVRSSLWTERAGEWRVRFHQGTRAESPKTS
ncbi:MAG: DUF4440 domain-containing protein [Terracidiphilus sp.]|jgi:glyoxylase I family protein